MIPEIEQRKHRVRKASEDFLNPFHKWLFQAGTSVVNSEVTRLGVRWENREVGGPGIELSIAFKCRFPFPPWIPFFPLDLDVFGVISLRRS